MPVGKMSDEAHAKAKQEHGSIADTIDRWRDAAETLDDMLIFNDGDSVLHRPDVTPYGQLEAYCQVPNDGVWRVLGRSGAGTAVDKGFELCEVCFDD